MKKTINRICNVVNLINDRYQNEEEFFITDDVICDVWDDVQTTYGNDYIAKSDVIQLIEMMVKYAHI